MPLSEEVKWGIVAAWKRLQNLAHVARQLRVGVNTVRRWVQRYVSTGGVKERPGRGRKAVMNDAVTARAVQLLLSDVCGTAAGAAQELCDQGLTPNVLHKNTVIRSAKQYAQTNGYAIFAARGKPRKQLSADTKRKRLAFAKANRTRTWGTVMFTDRKKFLFTYPGARVRPSQWLRKGEIRQAATVNHALGVNVYAGISRYGITKCHVVAGTSKHKTTFTNKKGGIAKNITAAEYSDVLQSTLLPEGKRIFSVQSIGTWTLQQDNDPTHKGAPAVVTAYNHKHMSSIGFLANWPPNSPDLNPIANVWAWVDQKVNAMGCKTCEEYSQTVLDQLKAVPKSMLVNLFDSMPKRMAKVIELHGDKTKY